MSDPAGYFDGRSAARRDVVVRFEANGIRIEGEGAYEYWPYAEIRYAGTSPKDVPLSFRCRSDAPGARLIVSEPATIERLRESCPDLADRVRIGALRRRGAVWSAAGVAFLALAAWSAIDFLPGIVTSMVPVSWEESLGDGVVDDIAELFGALAEGNAERCVQPAGRAALDRLAGRLIAEIETPYRIQVVVLDIGVVNAFAAPGGTIVVLGKLIEDARTPDEVAGVIAHEIGHVVARHPTEAVARGMGISLVFDALLGGLGGGATNAIGQMLVSTAYSRDAERDADTIALRILRDARISPKGFAEFFDRLAKTEGTVPDELAYFSSHPPSEERARAAHTSELAGLKSALSARDWNALKSICTTKEAR